MNKMTALTAWSDMDNTLVEKKDFRSWNTLGQGERLDIYEVLNTVDNYSSRLALATDFLSRGYEIVF